MEEKKKKGATAKGKVPQEASEATLATMPAAEPAAAAAPLQLDDVDRQVPRPDGGVAAARGGAVALSLIHI